MSENMHVYHHSARPFRALFLLALGFLFGGEVVAHHVGPAAPTAEQIRAYCVQHRISPTWAPSIPKTLTGSVH